MILGINEKWFRRRSVIFNVFLVGPFNSEDDIRGLRAALKPEVNFDGFQLNAKGQQIHRYYQTCYEPVADTLARAEKKFKRYMDSVKNELMCLFYDESTARSAVDVLEIKFARMVEKFKEETKGER